MARVTTEDCLKKINNRFILVHLTAKRVRTLLQERTTHYHQNKNNKEIVTALREIAAGIVCLPMNAEDIEPKIEVKLKK